MSSPLNAIQSWYREVIAGWDRFWFSPAEPHTLALIRILAGAMLFYTHLVWSLDLQAFLGPDSWITREASISLHQESYAWSHLWLFDSMPLVWTQHIVALIVFAMLTIGLWSRVTSILACLLTISYCHRLEGALFGLDQVNAMLAMYLAIGSSGSAYSVDRWLAKGRAGGRAETPPACISTNISIRLIQLHMCVIYLFGGVSKMKGQMWWDGSAVWYAISNLEYQSLDMTWMVSYPWLIALLSHLTVLWEMSYCFLIWPRLSRPVVLFIAVCVHGGIALFLGMITFGLAMLIANLSFVSPRVTDQCIQWLTTRSVATKDPQDRRPKPHRRKSAAT